MKILLYGFKPYKKFKSNITEEIINKISPRKDLRKVVFPVKFNKEIFLKEVRFYKPDIIIGLGQHARGKKIRIERKTINLKGNKDKGYRAIDRKGTKFQFVNLRLKKDNISRLSYKAGKYVCNFSIYILSKWSRENNVKFAFLHIPKSFNASLAVNFVESKIEKVRLQQN